MQYKVIAYSVSGKGRKIYYAGDIVNDNSFAEGVAQENVKNGHLEPILEKEVKEVKPKKPKTAKK